MSDSELALRYLDYRYLQFIPVGEIEYAQRKVELALIICAHAGWDELTATVNEIKPGELWITHGGEEALLRWSELNGTKARALALAGYDEDEGEA